MTKITFYQHEDGSWRGFDSCGHAGYAQAGEDIVCSAVSALIINFVNSLEEFTDDDYRVDTDQENAEINVEFTGKLSKEGNLLLKSLILGLTSIEEEQDKYLDVIFKEV